MDAVQLVNDTLLYRNRERIPMVYFNRDLEKADMIMIDVCDQFMGADKDVSEWGFRWERCDESMGQPSCGILKSEEEVMNYKKPYVSDEVRFSFVSEKMERYPGKYYLASFGLSGFSIMTCLRGFAATLEDMYLEENLFQHLADVVFDEEERIISKLKGRGFHGVAFFDDWGTQDRLIISPEKWREVFKPRYRHQFELVHALGMSEENYQACIEAFGTYGDYKRRR